MRILFAGYLFVLSGLLLTSQAKAFVLSHAGLVPPWAHLAPVGHFCAFLVLTVLAFMARLPGSRWAIVVGLLAFGSATEMLQTLVPHRSPELSDVLLNSAGIAVGCAFCWLAAGVSSSWRGRKRMPHFLFYLRRPTGH